MNTETFLLPSGLYLQVYIDSISQRDKTARLQAIAREFSAYDRLVRGVVAHDFPLNSRVKNMPSTPEERGALFVAAIKRGFGSAGLAGLSWGLDGRTDADETKLTAREKGERMARAHNLAVASFSMFDAEGQYDSDTGADDDLDEGGALLLGSSFRAIAPDAVVIDQPWFAPDSHGELRKTAKPIDAGGPIAGFPIDEFAVVADIRASQMYWANFFAQFGAAAYVRVKEWMERDWTKFEIALAAFGLKRPRTITIQGYGHSPAPWSVARCLVEYSGRPVFMWCPPVPSTGVVHAFAFVQRLLELAALRSVTLIEAVKIHQRNKKIAVDGIIGKDTWAKR